VYRMLLWHGTSASSAGGIIANGFNLGVSGLFGGGIYFADRFAKSRGYVQPSSTSAYLLLVEVDLGKVATQFETCSIYFISLKYEIKASLK